MIFAFFYNIDKYPPSLKIPRERIEGREWVWACKMLFKNDPPPSEAQSIGAHLRASKSSTAVKPESLQCINTVAMLGWSLPSRDTALRASSYFASHVSGS